MGTNCAFCFIPANTENVKRVDMWRTLLAMISILTGLQCSPRLGMPIELSSPQAVCAES
jgi:hypothetical protein